MTRLPRYVFVSETRDVVTYKDMCRAAYQLLRFKLKVVHH